MPWRTKIRIRISYNGVTFSSFASVASVRTGGGVGIAFEDVEPGQQLVLDQWVSLLRVVSR
jgi:hypothetical protein